MDTTLYGILTLETVDAEVPSTSPDCGKPAHYLTTLAGPGGALAISETGPRLCLGNVGAEPRHFVVTGGTGRYARAAGSGSIRLNVLSVGAAETWSGVITLHRRSSPAG